MNRFETAREAAFALRPDVPVYCFRPDVLAADGRAFKQAFPGKTAYAVKTNGEAMVLKVLVEDVGIDCFDVASPAEFAAVRAVAPKAELLYMTCIRSKRSRTFTRRSKTLVSAPTLSITWTRSQKFCELYAASTSIRRISPSSFGWRSAGRPPTSCRRSSARRRATRSSWSGASIGFKVGLCFHVGSQVEDTDTYERALASAAWVRSRAGAEIVALDIGGGFPAAYGAVPGSHPTPAPDTPR